jgi:hypothetical protein
MSGQALAAVASRLRPRSSLSVSSLIVRSRLFSIA